MEPVPRKSSGARLPRVELLQRGAVKKLLVHFLIVGAALGIAAYVIPGVTITSPGALIVGAIVLAFVNAIVRPILKILTFPITILTLGIFLLVVNAVCFGIAAFFVPGFAVSGFFSALFGAIAVSIVSTILGWILNADDEDDDAKKKDD